VAEAAPGGATASEPGAGEDANEEEEPAASLPAPPSIEACSAPTGTSGSPQSISELVALLNALPNPTTIACFLESLERPLEVYLTRSRLSAQPAVDARSPRTFIVTPKLLMSVVPDGVSSSLLELGSRSTPGRTIKAEIEFPLTRDITVSTLDEQVRVGKFSVCGGCHTAERLASDRFFPEGGFESNMITPLPGYEVDLEVLRADAGICDPTLEPLLCKNLGALFDHGEVRASSLWDQGQ
jgi:hypothetical protein